MKYSERNKPIECIMTQSTCYKETTRITPQGVLWHSTGANNKTVKRYVQPDDDATNRDELLEILGKNKNENDWNHKNVRKGVTAFIGKLADGSVAAVEVLPHNYRPWGCGSTSKGSCNDTHLQFEICEDALTDKSYFDAVYKEGCELTAYWCKMHNIDPMGTITYKGMQIPTIICHEDAGKMDLGSDHEDVMHWFKKYGKTMDDVRKDVAKLLKPSIPPVVNKPELNPELKPEDNLNQEAKVKKGDLVALADNAVYYSGKSVPLWVKAKKWYVREVSGDRAVINESEDKKNAINSPINVKYLIPVEAQEKVEEKEEFEPYLVKVTAARLNYRQGPGTSYKVKGIIKKNEIYTIVDEENGWGKLKSGAGWIKLEYTSKV